jgi:multidrug efflux pump subunit AcrA (membrane-fusion protein)
VQARTERDQAMDARDNGARKLAELEMERLDLKIRLLRNREQQLVIASPMDGVVLRGDLEDAEGAPVESGQTLFEIAPLDPINLELSILEEDLHSVELGMPVKARLDGYRGRPVTGTITRITPRSEIRDSENVFVAEVEISNTDGALRPGMNGRARITSRIRPLGWIWFHKAWYALRNFVGY